MKLKKVIFIALGLIVLFCFSFSAVLAAEFKFAKEGGNITVSSGEAVKNLYAAGNIVSIDGEVQKDLYAAGNIVTVGGSVEDNVCAAGGTVVIKNNVGGNVHAAGGSIVIEGNIAEDLFLAGGNILISKSASVKGDLIIGGGTVDIQCPVAGNVLIGGGEVTVNSKIGGFVKIKAEKIRIGESAEIERDLKYTSPEEAEIHENAKIAGAIDFSQKAIKGVSKPYATGAIFEILSVLFLLKILISIATGLVLIYFFKNIIKTAATEGMGNVWGSLGLGFAVLILTPVLGIILAVTVIGVYLTGLLSVAYVLLVMLSSVIANIIFGSWLIKVTKKKNTYSIRWQEVVVGVIVLKIIWLVPFVGWLICFIFMLISLGAMSKLIQKSITKARLI